MTSTASGDHVERPRLLISSASVAGPVLAYWLHRFGFRPTVIERVADLRVGGGGHAVDLFGPVVELMDWMGALPEVEQARTQTEVTALIRPARRPVEVPAGMLSEGVSKRNIEIMHCCHASSRSDPNATQSSSGP